PGSASLHPGYGFLLLTTFMMSVHYQMPVILDEGAPQKCGKMESTNVRCGRFIIFQLQIYFDG
ncbi:TPA: hypothetical protein ACTTVZ_003866, partial [Legionella anisa]